MLGSAGVYDSHAGLRLCDNDGLVVFANDDSAVEVHLVLVPVGSPYVGSLPDTRIFGVSGRPSHVDRGGDASAASNNSG